MNKQLPCLFLAFALFSLNVSPVQAANRKKKTNRRVKKQLVITPGEWCFQLPKMGLFCYQR
ncbi:MAG: hypothetical protein AAFO95_20810 [Cyanobacteria bacterium J06600_6]